MTQIKQPVLCLLLFGIAFGSWAQDANPGTAGEAFEKGKWGSGIHKKARTPEPNTIKGLRAAIDADIERTVGLTLGDALRAYTKDGKQLFRLNYSYSVKNAKELYITGVGTVPAQGTLMYLTENPSIEFRRSIDGPVLRHVQLSPATMNALKLSLELPSDKDFPQPTVGREQRWDLKRMPFALFIPKVLNGLKLLARVYEQDGVSYFVTTYIDLSGMPSNRIAQIAFRVSFPHRIGHESVWYRIEYTNRERPYREERWIQPAQSQEAQERSSLFLEILLEAIATYQKNLPH